MKKSSFMEGTIIATIAIIVVKIMGMLYVIPFYAMIGSGSTLYAYAYNIYSIFLDISTAGLPIAISKIINEYNTLGKIEAKQRAYKIGKQILEIASISIFAILFIFAPQIGKLLLGNLTGGTTYDEVALAIRTVSFSILIVPFLSISKGYLQGHNIIGVSSTSQVIEQVVRITIILIGSLLAIKVFKIPITYAVCIALSGAFFGALVSFIYVKVKIHKHKKELVSNEEVNTDISNKDIRKKIINYASAFIIISVIVNLYNFCDMVVILRTLNYIGLSASDTEFIVSSITTWCPKISTIISSIATGMTISLIPTIVNAFTLKDFHKVNQKLNQALQMIILVSIPMSIGIALLSKPVWNIFYGPSNDYAPMILSIVALSTFLGNLFTITTSTLQSLNKYKLVYKSAILGLFTNICLDVLIILLFNQIGFPVCLGASIASMIGYSISSMYALKSLKKEHGLEYQNTLKLSKSLFLPLISMIAVVMLFKIIIPVNYGSRLSCIIYTVIISIIGASIYLFMNYKNGNLEKVLGQELFQKFFKK
ncbi:MAG: polysaccharide biosynthesis protein, partial [Bacilli bacterium]|nr:polysaccharide biosynthesis protein [Bacilli bacterium]